MPRLCMHATAAIDPITVLPATVASQKNQTHANERAKKIYHGFRAGGGGCDVVLITRLLFLLQTSSHK